MSRRGTLVFSPRRLIISRAMAMPAIAARATSGIPVESNAADFCRATANASRLGICITFDHEGYGLESEVASPSRGDMMPSERFDFPNASGERLAALLDRPAGEPAAYALFAHCFTCGKDILAAKRIAERLTAAGIAVLRFDFTGLGMSGGEFANTTFSSNVAELVAAASHLRLTRRAPAILIGHSLGGAAVLAAAGDIAEARAVVTIAAPADPHHVTGLFKDRIDEIRARGEVEVTLAGRQFRVRRDFL